MSAGYRTLHVGKNGALALAAITGWQVFMPLVPLWSIIECSLHLNWYSVTWCGCGIQVPLMLLQFFSSFLGGKKRQNLSSLIATLWCVCGQLSAFIITPVILNELFSQLLD